MEENLADLRKNAGFKTQQDLANRLNVERVTISRWETGDREPRLEMIVSLSKELGVSNEVVIRAITRAKEETA